MACVVSQEIVKQSIAVDDGKENVAAHTVKTMPFVVIIWKKINMIYHFYALT